MIRENLLARLRRGPLPLDDYAEVAVSKGSLKVRIHNLRERGVEIDSLPVPNGNYRPRVIYRLVSGCCPTCGGHVG